MKFTETQYGNHTNILAFPDHYVAVPVMVDSSNATIVADSDGKKILSAGSIIGGGFLSDTDALAEPANTPGRVTLSSTGDNNDIVITNLTAKALKIALVDPSGNSQTLKLDVQTDTLRVLLATSAAGAITSTAAEVIALINANPLSRELVLASLSGTDTGEGVVVAVAAASVPAPAVVPEGILLQDVDVTHGDAPGAAVIHGFVSLTALASLGITPSAVAKSTLKGVHFVI